MRGLLIHNILISYAQEQRSDTMQGALLDRLTAGSHTLDYIKERNTLVGAGITCANKNIPHRMYRHLQYIVMHYTVHRLHYMARDSRYLYYTQVTLGMCMEVTYQLKLVHLTLATTVKMVTVGTLQILDDDNQYLMMKVMYDFIWNIPPH